MGGCSSFRAGSGPAATPQEAFGPAAKRYFQLEGLPVSVFAKAEGPENIRLTVAGLHCREALLQLEVVFGRRGFSLISAHLISSGDLIEQTYLLKYTGREEAAARTEHTPADPDLEIEIKLVPSAEACAEFPPKAKIWSVTRAQLLRVRAKGDYRVGMRTSVMEVLRKNNIRVLAAGFLSGPSKAQPRLDDTYWLPAEVATARPEFVVQLTQLLQKTMFAAHRMSLPQHNSSEVTPMKVYAAKNPRELLSAIQAADARNLLSHAEGLPSTLRVALEGLHYPVIGPCTSGVQIDGFVKYLGAGLSKSHNLTAGAGNAPVLEMRTLFIHENKAAAGAQNEQGHWLKRFMKTEKEYAEFVTSLDIQSKTWTICKAFLNDVLTSGKGHGAIVMAEHLLESPSTFFSAFGMKAAAATPAPPATAARATSDISSQGESAHEWPDWLPSLIDSIPDLETIHISDVVNWNTYMIMSMAAAKDRSTAVAMFGEGWTWAVMQELSRSGLTEESILTLSVMELFKHTGLGKLTLGAVKHFNTKRNLSLVPVGVEVILSRTAYENVGGQLRGQMDIKVSMSSGDRAGSNLAETSGLSKMKKAASGQDMRALDLDLQMMQTPDMQLAASLEDPSAAAVELADRVMQSLMPSHDMRAASKPPPTPGQATAAAVAEINLARGSMPTSTKGAADIGDIDVFVEEKTLSFHRLTSPIETIAEEPMPESFSDRASFSVLGLVGSITTLVHELQKERFLSCLAVSEKAADAESNGEAIGNMKQQWLRTNNELHGTLKKLEHLWKPISSNALFEEGVASFQHVSVKLMVQRPLVTAACSTPPPDWLHRFVVCCGGSSGYQNLIQLLLSWLTKALAKLGLRIDEEESQQASREFKMLSIFKEQLGKERAFLSSKALSSWAEHADIATVMRGLLKERHQLHELLGIRTRPWSDIPQVMKLLDEIEAALETNTDDPQEMQSWLAEISLCMQSMEDALQELLGQLLQRPETAGQVCLPVTFSSEQPAFPIDAPTPGSTILEISDSALAVDLANRLRDRHFTRVVVFTGAGISCSANIPDFRSPGGLYDQLKRQGFSTPETVFTRSFVEEHPASFYKIMQQLRTEDVEPTPTHHFLKLLQEKGLLLRCYTQNIDGLERKAGIPADCLVEAHGTMSRAKCLKCEKQQSLELMWNSLNKEELPRCSYCGGLLRPDIVFFGEQLPSTFMDLRHSDMKSADLVIIMGTSLSVQPFAGLVHQVRPDCPRVVFDLAVPRSLQVRSWQKMRSTLLSVQTRPDVHILGKCDEGIGWFCEQLGWDRELKRKHNKELKD